MKKKKKGDRLVAPEMSPAEIERSLAKIGKLINNKRKARAPLESFAYEINVSRSAMTKYESGGDMYLSTFIKLLYGLEIAPEDFFKEIR